MWKYHKYLSKASFVRAMTNIKTSVIEYQYNIYPGQRLQYKYQDISQVVSLHSWRLYKQSSNECPETGPRVTLLHTFINETTTILSHTCIYKILMGSIRIYPVSIL